ncbi:MAG TPA: archease [Nitrosopumilaceae archaeon]|nr:archease [Nitrosopumilaceae archaeon]
MSYKLLEHATDAFVEITASDLKEAFIQAGYSVVETTLERETIEEKEERIISVKGKDLKYLLFNWLEEVIFQLITEGFAIHRFKIELKKGIEYEIISTLYGEPINLQKHHFKVEIKAPTFHLMEIVEGKKVLMRFLLDL